MEVFRERGYQAATMGDIANRAGLLKGSLYYYIESKEDLLYEVLRRAHEIGLSWTEEDEATASADAPTRLAAFIRRWRNGLRTGHPDLYVSEHDIRFLSPPRVKEILELRRQLVEFAQGIVAQGIDEGSFAPEHDPSLTATTLYRVLTSGPLPRAPRAEWDQVTEWYVHLFLSALVTAPSNR